MGCAVCGDKVNGSRYGAPACLGCIVFFRRAITKDSKYKCVKGQNCDITFESRCICRSCRLDKCIRVGMNPSAIQRRDVMGPRKPKVEAIIPTKIEVPESPPIQCYSVASSSGSNDSWCSADSLMERLVRMQSRQRDAHKAVFAAHDPTITVGGNLFQSIDQRLSPVNRRRARKHDINGMLRCGINDASEWGQSFKEFRALNTHDKKLILQDFSFAVILIDSGYCTTQQPEKDLWILQNGTYMCPDYTRGLDPEELENVDKNKVKLHPHFVQEAIDHVANPMRALQIDTYECAVLKTLILLSYRNYFSPAHRASAYKLQSKLVNELMDYCKSKDKDTAPERFGSILLLTTNIRCSVYFTYVHCRMSDLFGMMTFDPLVRDVFLT